MQGANATHGRVAAGGGNGKLGAHHPVGLDTGQVEPVVAYLIGHITVKDPVKWAEYCSKVPATLTPWGASLVFRGDQAEVLAGVHAFTDTVVIRFPSRDAINAWHESAAYQALIPLREQAADVLIISYECRSD